MCTLTCLSTWYEGYVKSNANEPGDGILRAVERSLSKVNFPHNHLSQFRSCCGPPTSWRCWKRHPWRCWSRQPFPTPSWLSSCQFSPPYHDLLCYEEEVCRCQASAAVAWSQRWTWQQWTLWLWQCDRWHCRCASATLRWSRGASWWPTWLFSFPSWHFDASCLMRSSSVMIRYIWLRYKAWPPYEHGLTSSLWRLQTGWPWQGWQWSCR